MRAFGGAFGYGFARNLRDLYAHLACVYHPGDAIYLFGFSRGAYTVRGLAGLIATCGIVPGSGCSEPDLRHPVKDAYNVYRLGYRSDSNRENAQRRAEEFRNKYHVDAPGDPVRITFIGVWDMVGAVGFPDGTWPKRLLWIPSFTKTASELARSHSGSTGPDLEAELERGRPTVSGRRVRGPGGFAMDGRKASRRGWNGRR